MSLTFAALVDEALARWRRDRAVLAPLAGLLVFLPFFAWLLLLTPPVVPPELTGEARIRLVAEWMAANLHWLALRVGLELFGALAILTLYLGRGHRDVAGMLRGALVMFPLFVVPVLASWGLVTIGLSAFLLPGFYIYGRIALTGAVYVAEPGVGVLGAIARSVALTRQRGWQVFGYLALAAFMGLLAAQVLSVIEVAVGGPGGASPIVAALFSALTAAAVAVATVARLLLEVALYRRLAAPRHRV